MNALQAACKRVTAVSVAVETQTLVWPSALLIHQQQLFPSMLTRSCRVVRMAGALAPVAPPHRGIRVSG